MSIYSGITLLASPRGTRWHTVGLTEWTSTLKPDVNSKIVPGGLDTRVYSGINPVPVTEGDSTDIHSHRRLNEPQPSNLTWTVALNNWHLEDHFDNRFIICHKHLIFGFQLFWFLFKLKNIILKMAGLPHLTLKIQKKVCGDILGILLSSIWF